MDHSLHLEIPFSSERLAIIAMRVLNVDQELKADLVKRTITAQNDILSVHFECASVKMLRVASNSFLEMLTMVTRTMDHFDQESTDMNS